MQERLMSVKEVAALLDVSTYTIHRLKDKPGGIPAYKVGRLVKFKPSEVEDYIARQAVKPVEPPESFVKNRFKYVPGMKVVS